MGIHHHEDRFVGLPIRDYRAGDAIDGPAGVAHRLSVDWDSAKRGATFAGLLERFLQDPASRRATVLVIGEWESICDGDADWSAIDPLATARDRLPVLAAVFVGDVTSRECEISWIEQSDVGPLLRAYPRLEHLHIRGSNCLAFACSRHESLRTLIIESVGLSAGVVRQVAAADLPGLEHLELWLGTEDQGGDAEVADFAPILDGGRLPALRHLGLRNSERADQLAAALADAPILGRIESLDLLLGNLGDEGAVAILAGGNLAGLRRLDIHHHYLADEALDGLKALGLDLIDGDGRGVVVEADRSIAVSE